VECDADVVAHDLLTAVDRLGARRLVIDSSVELERMVAETTDVLRVPNYLAALVEALRRRRVSALLIKENSGLTTAALSLATDLTSVVAANVLWLQQVTYRDHLFRVLSVPKMRFSTHDTSLREFVIAAPDGLVVRAPFQSESGLLAQVARTQGSAAPSEPTGTAAP
jgi:circadian clock protein KaiC